MNSYIPVLASLVAFSEENKRDLRGSKTHGKTLPVKELE